MIRSISTNVVPPSVPSARKRNPHFGSDEVAKEVKVAEVKTETKPEVNPDVKSEIKADAKSVAVEKAPVAIKPIAKPNVKTIVLTTGPALVATTEHGDMFVFNQKPKKA